MISQTYRLTLSSFVHGKEHFYDYKSVEELLEGMKRLIESSAPYVDQDGITRRVKAQVTIRSGR